MIVRAIKIFFQLGFFITSQFSYAGDDNPFKSIDIANPSEVEVFFISLQNEIKKNDIKAIGEKIAYPLVVRAGLNKIIVTDQSEFNKNYKTIFNADVKAVILCQKYSELGAQWRGIMLGQGTLWFSLVFLKEQDKYNEKLHDDPNNREFWGLRITKINYGEVTRNFVNECNKQTIKEKQ